MTSAHARGSPVFMEQNLYHSCGRKNTCSLVFLASRLSGKLQKEQLKDDPEIRKSPFKTFFRCSRCGPSYNHCWLVFSAAAVDKEDSILPSQAHFKGTVRPQLPSSESSLSLFPITIENSWRVSAADPSGLCTSYEHMMRLVQI